MRPAKVILSIAFAASAHLIAYGGAAFLDASQFQSLGVFAPSENVIVDLRTARMSGGAQFTGVTHVQAGTSMLVFTFSAFTLKNGVSITFADGGTNSPAVAFLSHGDMTIAGLINANGENAKHWTSVPALPAESGPGGWRGSFLSWLEYTGPGGSAYSSGGGAGFGGAGGVARAGINGPIAALGGATYNPDLSAKIIGGSGGGKGFDRFVSIYTFFGGFGGGGGGAVQLGALKSLVVTGAISANGGAGGQPDTPEKGPLDRPVRSETAAGGGGSGGAILIHARQVLMQGNLSACGGNAGGPLYSRIINGYLIESSSGGSGGGGRIHVAYKEFGTNSGQVNIAGGSTTNFASPGTFVFAQDSTVPELRRPTIVTQPRSLTNLVGTAASFIVQANAIDAHFVWRHENTILGGDSNTLTLGAVAPADAGTYSVIVTNSAGSQASAPAFLIVVSPTLTATRSGDQLGLSWSENLPTALLEQRSALSPTTEWTPISTSNSLISIQLSNQQSFYRLRIP
jgi:hypothetical protein